MNAGPRPQTAAFGGRTPATVPLDDHETLREAFEGAAGADAMRRAPVGPEETIPFERVERMPHGESTVRVRRERRGMKARDLAGAARVSRSRLRTIGNGDRRSPVGALEGLAEAWGIDDIV